MVMDDGQDAASRAVARLMPGPSVSLIEPSCRGRRTGVTDRIVVGDR